MRIVVKTISGQQTLKSYFSRQFHLAQVNPIFSVEYDIIHTLYAYIFQVVERRKQIEIEEQEIRRKEKELMSTVKLPAEAEAYKVQTIAEGKRFVCILYYFITYYVVLYTGRKILEKIHLLKTASRYSKNTYIYKYMVC